MGCKPVKQYGVNLMYLSPLRTEKHASFKVNTEINQWYDFGIGRGGNIIALAELLYNSSDVSYLIHQIERNAPSSVSGSLPTIKPITPQNSFEHLQVLPITHPALIKYLEERCIDIETARTVCKELHFDTRGKHYFGILPQYCRWLRNTQSVLQRLHCTKRHQPFLCRRAEESMFCFRGLHGLSFIYDAPKKGE